MSNWKEYWAVIINNVFGREVKLLFVLVGLGFELKCLQSRPSTVWDSPPTKIPCDNTNSRSNTVIAGPHQMPSSRGCAEVLTSGVWEVWREDKAGKEKQTFLLEKREADFCPQCSSSKRFPELPCCSGSHADPNLHHSHDTWERLSATWCTDLKQDLVAVGLCRVHSWSTSLATPVIP
jgi:hypothetical protein